MKQCLEIIGSTAYYSGGVELQRCLRREPCWKHHGGQPPLLRRFWAWLLGFEGTTR